MSKVFTIRVGTHYQDITEQDIHELQGRVKDGKLDMGTAIQVNAIMSAFVATTPVKRDDDPQLEKKLTAMRKRIDELDAHKQMSIRYLSDRMAVLSAKFIELSKQYAQIEAMVTRTEQQRKADSEHLSRCWNHVNELEDDVNKLMNKNSPIGESVNDDSEPITEGWLLSVGFAVRTNCQHLRLYDLGKACIEDYRGVRYQTQIGDKCEDIKTRRDVRILCELLRIELKEDK